MNQDNNSDKMTISISDEVINDAKELHGIDAIEEVSKAVAHELNVDTLNDGRRVFYVDVGNLPDDQAKTYLDAMKATIKNAKVEQVDRAYNPLTMMEDYFFGFPADAFKPKKKYYSTKKIGPISTGHRQWRDDKHCKFAHGYGRYVQFTFECDELDHRSWVVDFGGLKQAKKWLEDQWDHRMLIASDDPLLAEFERMHELGAINLNVMDVSKGYGPGIEASCNFIYDNVNPMIEEMTNGRCRIKTVEIWEHEFNTARLDIEYPIK